MSNAVNEYIAAGRTLDRIVNEEHARDPLAGEEVLLQRVRARVEAIPGLREALGPPPAYAECVRAFQAREQREVGRAPPC